MARGKRNEAAPRRLAEAQGQWELRRFSIDARLCGHADVDGDGLGGDGART
jgi:hypothetical protein